MAALIGCALVGLLSAVLILDDFEAKVIEHADLFEPFYRRLNFLGRGAMHSSMLRSHNKNI